MCDVWGKQSWRPAIQPFGSCLVAQPVVKNLPVNAGDMGSISWSRRIPRASGQLHPSAATTEAHAQSGARALRAGTVSAYCVSLDGKTMGKATGVSPSCVLSSP